MECKGKTALVTGGAVRIGSAIGRALAQAGMNVVIHYRHSGREARSLARELQERFGVSAWTARASFASENACRRLIKEASALAGGLDVLVNNAAVFHKDSIRQTTARKLRDEFWPNLFAPLLLMRFFAELGRGGKIVNLLDRRIEGLDVDCAPYALSKKGLAEATRLAAKEFAPSITVNAVAPGAIFPPPGSGKSRPRDMAGPSLLQRKCPPDDVAAAVLFLLQNDSVTGQTIFVDGGQSLL